MIHGGMTTLPAEKLPAGSVSLVCWPPYGDWPIDEYWGEVVDENETHIRIRVGEVDDTITKSKGRRLKITRSALDAS